MAKGKKWVAVLTTLLMAAPLAADWTVKRETVGEGVPTWLAVVKSRDSRLLFWIEYPTDQICVPHVILKSDDWEAFTFNASRIEHVTTVIRFSRERVLQVPGYAANGFIFEWELEKSDFAEMLAGFSQEKEFRVSLPGRAGEVVGTLDLAGAIKAIQGACAACEESYLVENDYVFPDSAERLLTTAEVARLSPALLRIARNEIFARHGRVFQDPFLDKHFRSKSWYHPVDRPTELTATEKTNLRLFASLE